MSRETAPIPSAAILGCGARAGRQPPPVPQRASERQAAPQSELHSPFVLPADFVRTHSVLVPVGFAPFLCGMRATRTSLAWSA